MNRAAAVGRLERAIENRQVFGFQAGRALDSSLLVHEVHDGFNLGIVIAELPQRGRYGIVDDLDGAATHQLLVLHERQVGLDAGRVAIHHEANRPGRRQHCRLRVTIPMQHTKVDGIRPDGPCRIVHLAGNVVPVDPLDGLAVRPHHIQERLPVHVETRARPHLARNLRRLQICLAGHHGRDGCSVVAPVIAVVGNALRHQQRAQVGITQTERAEVERVDLDLVRRIARKSDDDLLRCNRHIHGLPERFDIKPAVFVRELHQVQRRQVACRIIQEHVFGARVRSVDRSGVPGGVPPIDRRVVLDAGIAADVCRFGNHLHHVLRFVRVHHVARRDRVR